ncbi:MAG: 2-amino-3-carboxymuconate-6-semialdehyde decarboxylase, partial [Betaproteobacteria bacterium]|nr:2-amino-3-carboxymuconate-6-semialdehyde decarboxylase [Betaproteobacteria bacterium]
MLCPEWLDLLKARGAPRVTVKRIPSGEWIHVDGVPFMLPVPAMFDYEHRFKAMDGAGVDMAVLSLTGPNVYWGDEAASTRAAELINDSFAAAQRDFPKRIRWMASLPFEYPRRALEELA